MRIEKKFERSTVNFARMSFFFANERFWGSSMGRVDAEVKGALDHTRARRVWGWAYTVGLGASGEWGHTWLGGEGRGLSGLLTRE